MAKGSKAPKVPKGLNAGTVADAMAYTQQSSEAFNPLINYFLNAAGRVPTEAETKGKIGGMFDQLRSNMVPNTGAGQRGVAGLASAMGMSPDYYNSGADIAADTNTAYVNALNLSETTAQLTADQSASSMKEQYLASLADARSKKKSAGSDWLTSYSALDTLLRAGQRGSGTTTTKPDDPVVVTPSGMTPAEIAAAASKGYLIGGKGGGSAGVAGGLPAMDYVLNKKNTNK